MTFDTCRTRPLAARGVFGEDVCNDVAVGDCRIGAEATCSMPFRKSPMAPGAVACNGRPMAFPPFFTRAASLAFPREGSIIVAPRFCCMKFALKTTALLPQRELRGVVAREGESDSLRAGSRCFLPVALAAFGEASASANDEDNEDPRTSAWCSAAAHIESGEREANGDVAEPKEPPDGDTGDGRPTQSPLAMIASGLSYMAPQFRQHSDGAPASAAQQTPGPLPSPYT
mmetsp:Transcript_119242/g.337306  ORF Transcript_119242/g.337306 Transcript_119242/m.337306 type:complete len:229 (+) Transcript_119242:438-1124(+)